MSLHAQISAEAQAKLDAQKRNSTISAVIIALLSCALIVAILFYIALSPLFKKNAHALVTYQPGSETKEKPLRPEMKNEVTKTPSSPSAARAKVITAHTPSAVAVPVTNQIITEPSPDFGNGDDFGNGWQNGNTSNGFRIPTSMKNRCSAKDRIKRLLKEGGKKSYENKVVKSLRWLQRNQQKDGSWSAQGKPVAMTGLALLAYLGHCETPKSPEFGETVEKAILYLVNVSQKNNGQLASNTTDKHWCYEHAIATYALAEAYTLCKEFNALIPKLKESVKKAGDQIIGNQSNSGSWSYGYRTSAASDSSIACWHLQALKACKTTGIKFSGIESSAKKGIQYLEKCKLEKGTIGYKPNKMGSRGPTMTPGAALCYQQWGKGSDSFTKNAVQWITDNNQFDYKKYGNLYMNYYSSQAVINAGGNHWKAYNKQTMECLAEKQNSDGSWPLPGDRSAQMSSPHYATCLATLMMEVYYRFLPSSE